MESLHDRPTGQSRLPDVGFDSVGYAAGKAPLPHVPAVLQIQPSGGDDTLLVQAALNELSARSGATTNFRGALILSPGTFRIEGQLRITASGIVIRGGTDDRHPTRIIAVGTSRRTLIEIGSASPRRLGDQTPVSALTIPAGSSKLPLAEITGFAPGDRIVIQRPSTKEWIASLGMSQATEPFAEYRTHWLPGSRDLHWNRAITAIDPHQKTITLDAPITLALEPHYGGGTVAKIISGAPLIQIGIEDLVLESEYDPANPKDEEHAWIAISLDRVEDAWVRRVTTRHFAGAAVRVGPQARRVTVENCRNEHPVSEIGGYRRQSFLVQGQQTLVQRCQAEAGWNDFAVGFCAAGPNVFRDCEARAALGPSGALESWACGVLYENVHIEGAELRLTRDDTSTQGAGWTSANSAVVNSEATCIVVQGPESAPNIVIQEIAEREASPIPEKRVSPDNSETTHNQAPLFLLPQTPAPNIELDSLSPLKIIQGRFVSNARVIWGGQVNGGWWLGQLSPRAGQDAGVSITRFAPGLHGTGLTEKLPELAGQMQLEGMRFYSSGPAIWYDRRRDDHSIEARTDAKVWAPFYEMPWARSGQGTAWDGLSRYDLEKFNPWYFERTHEFARHCEHHGLVLYHALYNTHHVLESPAHWVDFPWRPVNCLNDTGLPDHPPRDAAGGIHLANEFYNVDHPVRRDLHRAYIRHNLEQLGNCPNVIFSLAHQFAGPLAFQEFFLDTVAAWEQETGRQVRLALVTSKDITEAILAKPTHARQIAVIDLRYWQTQPDGTLWAPRGDQNRAFREMTSEQFGPQYGDTPPPTTPHHVYHQVREYRDRFPDKAIIAWHGGAGSLPILMAGGAQALLRNPASGQSQGLESDQTPIDTFVREHLSETLMSLLPQDDWLTDPHNNWCLSDANGNVLLLYSLTGPKITLAQKLPTSHYTGLWFNPHQGHSESAQLPQHWNLGDTLNKPTSEEWLLLLQAKSPHSVNWV